MNIKIMNKNMSNEYIQITNEKTEITSMDISDVEGMIAYHEAQKAKLLDIKAKYTDLKNAV